MRNKLLKWVAVTSTAVTLAQVGGMTNAQETPHPDTSQTLTQDNSELMIQGQQVYFVKIVEKDQVKTYYFKTNDGKELKVIEKDFTPEEKAALKKAKILEEKPVDEHHPAGNTIEIGGKQLTYIKTVLINDGEVKDREYLFKDTDGQPVAYRESELIKDPAIKTQLTNTGILQTAETDERRVQPEDHSESVSSQVTEDHSEHESMSHSESDSGTESKQESHSKTKDTSGKDSSQGSQEKESSEMPIASDHGQPTSSSTESSSAHDTSEKTIAVTIHDVYVGDTTVSGVAAPQATVTVAFNTTTKAQGILTPVNAEEKTIEKVTVDADKEGKWTVNVPANVKLVAGDLINATATDSSDQVTFAQITVKEKTPNKDKDKDKDKKQGVHVEQSKTTDKNKKDNNLPDTGEKTSPIIYGVGALAIIGGIALLVPKFRKKD